MFANITFAESFTADFEEFQDLLRELAAESAEAEENAEAEGEKK